MRKNIELLLVENVDNLGIVGDVVNVRIGYARNFLLPRALATKPSDELIKQLAGKRADAQRILAEERKQREVLCGKLQGVAITLVRSCNDQGILYGAITQQEIATALNALGHGVKARDIRLGSVIKRVDKYDVHVKLDSDLDASVHLTVNADRKLERQDAEEERRPQAEGEAGGERGDRGGERGGERGDREGRGGGRRDRDAEPEGRKKSALDMALEAAAASDAKRKGGAAGDSKSEKGDKGKGDKKKSEKKGK
jgi:large subunit ribosomal protein L9